MKSTKTSHHVQNELKLLLNLNRQKLSYRSNLKVVDNFNKDRRNGKTIISSHTQVEVPGFEPWPWHPA
ncbi:hypothetical protein MTR_3g061805 [Medicago truncatula]|uniref:Uncharacterized protein n=1 Tax=Medicago truncatula TaxID=3880 RepID=A0A072UWZ4_MEDTR|nr:hypothetical protein MTR_3g061805 [Medicago truncatula]